MWSVIFKVWCNLPSRAIAVAGTAVSTYAAISPKDFKDAVSSLMTPEQIRVWGIVALIVCVVYWTIYIFLKRKGDGMDNRDDEDGKGGGGGRTSGDGSHIFSGNFNGDVNINAGDKAPPAPLTGIKLKNLHFKNADVGIFNMGAEYSLDGATFDQVKTGIVNAPKNYFRGHSFGKDDGKK